MTTFNDTLVAPAFQTAGGKAALSGDNGGHMQLLHPASGIPHIELIANETVPANTGGGLINVTNGGGTATLQLTGHAGMGGGLINIADGGSTTTAVLRGDNGGFLQLFHPNGGNPHVEITANEIGPDNTGGGLVNVTNGGGDTTIQLNGHAGAIGIGTTHPDRPLTIQAQGSSQELVSFKDPNGATKWHINQDLGGLPGLNFVETGIADGRLFLKAGGNVGIGTFQPVTALHVAGNLTVDSGGDPVLFTGTGTAEHNRYLNLINSPEPNFRSASGLKAGGILVADGYDFANPGKNDLVVKGTATIHGDVLLAGGDCAEDFDVAATDGIGPGAVMVMNEEGTLEPCGEAYDKRVIGVIAGAGGLRPGIVLDKQPARGGRMPLTLLGKTGCMVDAGYAPIEVGDLLVASPTRAHAMKAADPARAFGAVLGKALRGLKSGRGVIPILAALR